MEKEEAKILNDGSQFTDLTSSPGWSKAKEYLNQLFVELDSWSTLPPGLNQTQKVKTMESRIEAIRLVKEWVALIEGISAQGITLKRALIDRTNASSFIKYFPETENIQENGTEGL